MAKKKLKKGKKLSRTKTLTALKYADKASPKLF